MRRTAVLLSIAASLIAAPAAHAATLGGWNRSEQRAVAAAGVLPNLPDGRFHGERPLSGAQLGAALTAVAARSGAPAVAAGAGERISVTAFDARLVDQLGLADVAAHVQDVARQAGLRPPAVFGTEVVARYLGLRENHPFTDDALELYPTDAITRAEAAHSFAAVLHFGDWEAEGARAQLSAFALPTYTGATRRALRLAVSKIGMPYIWGGETDRASSVFGYQAHGGYDCSGFVWRVFKLSGQAAGRRIGGRTAAQMAGEITRRARLRLDQVRPGDLLFFGPAHFNSKATERGIVHVGIALSPHWMIHSSEQGVYVSSLDDSWRQDWFAWARRVL
jgi:cell wall-associated NlpC family hydrolase